MVNSFVHWLVALIFLFSVWVNVTHGYEQDEHDHHPEECEICFVLFKVSDDFLVYHKSEVHLLSVRYTFTLANNYELPTSYYFIHPRAPPHSNEPI